MLEEKNQEIGLLYGETILSLKANEDVQGFNVLYAIPLEHGPQTPLFFNVKKDATGKIISYKIEEDKHPPNKLVNFRLGAIRKGELVDIHFEYWVFVKDEENEELPSHIKIPDVNSLPDETKLWLGSTEAIQASNFIIKVKARFLRGFSKNLSWLAKKIAFSICYHRYSLTLIRTFIEKKFILRRIFFRNSYWTGLMDAVSAYFFGGLCTARNNLEVALFRVNKVPSRVLIGTITYYGKKWLDAQHFLFEYYCPSYGWIRGMSGKVPYNAKDCMILRVCYPEDEDIAGNGFSYYGGSEPWFWITDANISLVFPKVFFNMKRDFEECYGTPGVRGWIESEMCADKKSADDAFQVTKDCWFLFNKYFGLVLNDKNKECFECAVELHKNAIKNLSNSNLENYIENLNFALEHYRKIEIR